MRAYTRTNEQRIVDQIAVSAVHTRAGAPPGRTSSGAPPFWSRFTQVLEDALQGEGGRAPGGLLRLARCGRLDVTRVFDCGAEEEAVEAWCGHPYCPACAAQHTAKAARNACDTWPERVVVAEVPIGVPGGIVLPSPEAVGTVREAWGRVTKRVVELTGLERLEVVPRAVVQPDGLSLFVRLPWEPVTSGFQEHAEQGLETALRRATREVGLRDVQVRVTSREAAGLELRRFMAREGERFQERVARDLERLDTFAWRGDYPADASLAALLRATTRQWTTRLVACHKTLRRSRLLGSRHALGVPGDGGPALSKRRCPDHGGRCRVVSTRVRDRAREGSVVRELPGEALSGAFNRNGVAALLEDASPAPIRLQVCLPGRLRRAG